MILLWLYSDFVRLWPLCRYTGLFGLFSKEENRPFIVEQGRVMYLWYSLWGSVPTVRNLGGFGGHKTST